MSSSGRSSGGGSLATLTDVDAATAALDHRRLVYDAIAGKFKGVAPSGFNVKDYGAIGDGTAHALSTRFASLAAAQVVYPFALSTAQQIDWCAITAAILAANAAIIDPSRTSAIYMPQAAYRTDAEVVATGAKTNIYGDGKEASVIQPLTDFGKGYYALRPDILKAEHFEIRGIGVSGPTHTSSPGGPAPCKMHGLLLAGGNCSTWDVRASYFYRGIEFAADHSSVYDTICSSNYLGLFWGLDRNAEADQYIGGGSNFASNIFSSWACKGSNMIGGVSADSAHLGDGPYGIYGESSTPVAGPTTVANVGGSTGAPFTAGGTFFYFYAPLYGVVDEAMVSAASAATVVAAGGSATITMPADADATAWIVYRATSATPGTTTVLARFVSLTNVFTDTGPSTATTLVPLWPNQILLSGAVLRDCPCEAYGNGYIYSVSDDSVTRNLWLGASTANAFTTDRMVVGQPQRASVKCGVFDSNIMIGDVGSLLTPGPDSDGCAILAAGGTNGNVLEPVDLTWISNTKPIWTATSGTPTLVVKGPKGKQGHLVKLDTGAVTANDLIGTSLSSERLKRYPAGGTGPVHGVAAQDFATVAGYFLMWEPGQRMDLASTDASITSADTWLKPDPSNAGKVVKAAGPWDGPAVAWSYAGLASGVKVDSRLVTNNGGGDPNAILQTLIDAKGDLLIGSADNTIIRKAIGTNGQVLTADSTQPGGAKWATLAGATGGWAGLLGDGSDGALVLDGTSAVTGFSRSGTTYTLNRECHSTTFTVNTGVTVKTQGYAIFCQGAFVNAGTIHDDGTSSVATAGAGGGGSGTWSSGGNGGNGATGTPSTPAAVSALAVSGLGGAGGAGSTGSAGPAGVATSTVAKERLKIPSVVLTSATPVTGAVRTLSGGTGGGGGGGDGTNSGGGGGAGGGSVIIFALSIDNTGGTIRSAGGNGFTPTTGNCGGGGGGGGGPVVLFTTTPIVNAGTLSSPGGTHGNGVGTGANGTDGAAGTVFQTVLA
jgi:hypothetical protein